jgi:hypothetical protein
MDLPSELETPEQRAHYLRALEKSGPRFALMVALGQPPGTKGTDRAFLEGRQNNEQLDSMPRRQAAYVAKEARQAGINISGKYYCAGIADKRGWRDPAAWVTSSDDVLSVARKRKLHVTGSVNYDPGEAPPKRTLLSESIIKDELRKAKRANPKAKAGELRERIIEKHAYKVKGRNL